MKTIIFNSQEEWLQGRLSKITGTRLKNLVKKRKTEGEKIGYYELIAERIAIPSDGSSALERGQELQSEAIQIFEKETGKKVNTELIIWMREDCEDIAISPDGIISETEAIEVKCLSSANHIKAFFEGIPEEFYYQKLQYFIVNDKLKTLYFCFYDPRLQVKDFHYYVIEREEVEDEIEEMLRYEKEIIQNINNVVDKLLDGSNLAF